MLETARLTLRRLVPTDADFVLELLNDPAFIRNVGDKGVRTAAGARGYIAEVPQASYDRNGFGLYRVALKGTDVPIGICGLVKRESLADVDVGFALLPRFWSQGYALESVVAVLAEARDAWGLARVVAVVAPHNLASRRLLEKLGFGLEGIARLSSDGPDVHLFAARTSSATG
jgi:[ribosomal protein S5]-alanine N-acetyltransferase